MPLDSRLRLSLGELEHLGLETQSDGLASLGLDGVASIDEARDGVVLVDVRQCENNSKTHIGVISRA